MKRAALPLALLLVSGGIWAWALWWPKPPTPLPERFVGTYRLVRFEPPPGVNMANPYPSTQTRTYELRADGGYRVAIRVGADRYEMQRFEGRASVDERGRLRLAQVSRDLVPEPAEPDVFATRWEYGQQGGETLVLTHTRHRYELYLRRLAATATRKTH